MNLLRLMTEQGAAIELMHVGETEPPPIRRISDGAFVPVTMRTGDVVNTILKEAEEQNVDLIAMPTAEPLRFSRCGAHEARTERVPAACTVPRAVGADRVRAGWSGDRWHFETQS